MTNEVVGLPRGRSLTRADLDQMPDDGHRYELVDGLLIVSPAPRQRHQVAARNLSFLLHAACPAELAVLFAPFDVVLSDDTVLQPDILIAPKTDYTASDLPTAPLLAVEILSPSTRAYDLLLKKDQLQRAGCLHYWVIDPDLPAVQTWTLIDGAYHDSGSATGDEVLAPTTPVVVEIRPTELVTL